MAKYYDEDMCHKNAISTYWLVPSVTISTKRHYTVISRSMRKQTTTAL